MARASLLVIKKRLQQVVCECRNCFTARGFWATSLPPWQL